MKFFLKKENPIFSIKLGQNLPKLFSRLHVKNSRFFLPYFSKKRRLAQGIQRPTAAGFPLQFSVKIRPCIDLVK